jgi:flagellar hook-length control protein FliK
MSSMNGLSSSNTLGASTAAKPAASAPPTPSTHSSAPQFAHWLQQSSQALQQDDAEPKDKPAAKAAEPRPAAKPAAKTAQAGGDEEASATEADLKIEAGDDTSLATEAHAEDEATTEAAEDNPAQQILALLRGDAPAERAKPQTEAGAADAQEQAGEDSGLGRADARRGHAAARQAELRLEQQAARAEDAEAAQPEQDQASAQATEASGASPLSAPLQAGIGSEAGARPPALPGDAGNFQALLAQAQQAQAPGSASAAATQSGNVAVPLHAALHSAQFAPELSASLTLLVQDGVQQAQLHLNPAEMGPVAVQIQLDGQQAQISFHAEQAETRQVLERSLPELAAALQAQGLTLSGGGVFQQSGGQAQSGGARAESGAATRSRDTDAPDSALPPLGGPPARQTRGLLDLYA